MDQDTIDRGINLDSARAALAGQGTVQFRGLDVTVCEIDGQRVMFATDFARDPIQRANRNGTFYEQEELEILRAHVPKSAVFVDIGANVGNHCLFAGLVLKARKIIPFEPNPLAYRLLMMNILLNGLQKKTTFDQLGFGLSDVEAAGFGMEERHKNLGAAKMLAGQGDIAVSTGDLRLARVKPNFIKIDVEGMEMGVLRGLEKTIKHAKPRMFIEVDRENYDAFDGWLEAADYTVLDTFQRYATNKNFLIAPKGAQG